MRDKQRTNKQTLKIEQLSQWKLEAEFRKNKKISKISIKEVSLPVSGVALQQLAV